MFRSTNPMNEVEFFVLKYVCQQFENNGGTLIQSADIFDAAQKSDFLQQDVKESIRILGEKDLLKRHPGTDMKDYPAAVHPTPDGFGTCYRRKSEEYNALESQIGWALVNSENGSGSRNQLAKDIGSHEMLVEYILQQFEQKAFVRLRRPDGDLFVTEVSPLLERWLDSQSGRMR